MTGNYSTGGRLLVAGCWFLDTAVSLVPPTPTTDSHHRLPATCPREQQNPFLAGYLVPVWKGLKEFQAGLVVNLIADHI
jgi:hypothetical protein